jgi:hypothetical protein
MTNEVDCQSCLFINNYLKLQAVMALKTYSSGSQPFFCPHTIHININKHLPVIPLHHTEAIQNERQVLPTLSHMGK